MASDTIVPMNKSKPAIKLDLKLYAPGELDNTGVEALWQLLVAADNEFVPSLSERRDTMTKRLVIDELHSPSQTRLPGHLSPNPAFTQGPVR